MDNGPAIELYNIFGLRQQINEPTRITPHSQTLLDHVYTCGLDDVTTSTRELHIADHCAVFCTIPLHNCNQLNSQNHKTNTFCSMKNFNQEALCNELSKIQWSDVLSAESNANDIAQKFNEIFISVWNKHVPIITRRIRKNGTPRLP